MPYQPVLLSFLKRFYATGGDLPIIKSARQANVAWPVHLVEIDEISLKRREALVQCLLDHSRCIYGSTSGRVIRFPERWMLSIRQMVRGMHATAHRNQSSKGLQIIR
jgi:hypothetical protein